ncbi:hypothetical protein BH24CHL8_BH24CHL8_08830 [soil metagenome]
MDEQEQGGTIGGGNEMPEGTQTDPGLRAEFADTQRVDTSGAIDTSGEIDSGSRSRMGGGSGMGAGQGSRGAATGGALDDAMLERAQEAGDPVGVGDTGTGRTDEKIEEPPPGA